MQKREWHEDISWQKDTKVMNSAPRFNMYPKTYTKRIDARPSAAKRGYDRNWKRIRIQVLIRDNYTCQDCGDVVDGKDAHVDHVIPLAAGGTNELSNLKTRCIRCHSKKTAKEDGGFGNRGRGASISTSVSSEDHVLGIRENLTGFQ
jgi:5-methylcytosine-specific restriction protein A